MRSRRPVPRHAIQLTEEPASIHPGSIDIRSNSLLLARVLVPPFMNWSWRKYRGDGAAAFWGVSRSMTHNLRPAVTYRPSRIAYPGENIQLSLNEDISFRDVRSRPRLTGDPLSTAATNPRAALRATSLLEKKVLRAPTSAGSLTDCHERYRSRHSPRAARQVFGVCFSKRGPVCEDARPRSRRMTSRGVCSALLCSSRRVASPDPPETVVCGPLKKPHSDHRTKRGEGEGRGAGECNKEREI